MKILHVVPTYLPAYRYGGPIYSVHGLCKALAAIGHDVHVFTTNVDGSGDSDVPLGESVDVDGVKVCYFASERLRRLYWSPPMLAALKQELPGFEIIHLHSVFLWPTWATARCAKRAGVPYLVAPRGMLVRDLFCRKSRWIKTAWLHLIERNNIEQASGVHVTSKIEAEALNDFSFRLPPIFVVPNGIDPPSKWTSLGVNNDVRQAIERQPYVLFFGRINWEKGSDRLIKAWRDIPHVHLVIAGNDEERYLPILREVATAAGVTEWVTFLARQITGADKEALFASARLFVLPSYSENFGNTVLEAMVRSLPVIVTEEVGAGIVVSQAGAGNVVPAKQLAEAILSILQDEDSLKAMGQNGREWAIKDYSWNHVAQQMIQCYHNIIQNGRKKNG